MEVRGGWVLEIDIRKFFDTLDHRHLHAILRRRVRDGVLLRLIGKWLKAGVLEEGSVTHPETGSPQGGVISPILANAYLHEVLDTWFEQTVKPRLKGRASLIRYADDAVLVFEVEGRRATGSGRASQTLWQVRPGSPPGEDPAGPVPGATAGSPTGLP
jgi:RNA-directed DNA polymerase